MYQDLRVAFNSLVKLLISLGSLINADLVRDNEAWVCPARDDHVAQVSIVSLNVALTGANCETLTMSLDQASCRQNHLEIKRRLTFSKSLPKLINIMP